MDKKRLRICRDYESTLDCFSYLLCYAPNLPEEDDWTFQEAFADFREGVVCSLNQAGLPVDSHRRTHVLMMVDLAYKLFTEPDPRAACSYLQDAEAEFIRLCQPRKG